MYSATQKLYIALKHCTVQEDCPEVSLAQIAELYGKDIPKTVWKERFAIQQEAVSSLAVIARMHALLPQCECICIGASQSLIKRQKPPDKRWVRFVKIAIACVVLFFGGAGTIINFHNDVNMADVHHAMTQAIGGENTPDLVINIAYSIGMAAGIILFLFHSPFQKKRGLPDPLELKYKEYTDKIMDWRRTNP